MTHYSIFLHHIVGYTCRGDCAQGEGDCDSNGDCIDGLVCEFDGWWGDDYCRAGILNRIVS